MNVIRKPKLDEVVGIKQLLDNAAQQGDLLRRPLMELYETVRDFYTYVDEQGVAACCALHIDTLDLAEVRSLVVRPDLRDTGIGGRLLDRCLDEARSLKISSVYALTRTPSFFARYQFEQIEKHDLPHKVFNDCIRCPLFPDCDEVAMVKTLAPANSEEEAAPGLLGAVGFLGFGNMGSAIVQGLITTGTITPSAAIVYDLAEGRRAAAANLDVRVAESPRALAEASDVLLLAVKPQNMAEALDQIRPGLKAGTLVISIAAGISIGYIQSRLGRDVRVVRVMPNTPALVRAGAAGIAMADNCTESDKSVARAIFGAIGIAEFVSEDMMDTVTALSGSGPAYFFYVVELLVRAAQAHGLEPDKATRLAAQTLFGAGQLLKESSEGPSVLRERVTSKGGTTAAALEAFRAGGFEKLIAAGVDAAVARSKELGK
ncbi:MAG TPA: pyrroline-5-carboxylate reductase [Candidatus Bathyarchaeia archaeon]|nr:pyrroline-5-carboxylate reductase [Candidatus Bathyarchaeia archaeon]